MNTLLAVKDYQFLFDLLISAIGGLFSGWLFTKYKINKQLNANITEEKLKKELEKNNSLLISAINNFSATQSILREKQIQAIELLWGNMLLLKDGIPTPIPLLLSFFKDSELNFDCISRSEYSKNAVDSASFLKFFQECNKYNSSVNNYRFYLSPDLYNIWRGYLICIGRVVWLFVTGYKSRNLATWKSDRYIKDTLSTILTADEIQEIYSKEFSGFDILVETLQLKSINEISNNLGEQFVIDITKQISIFERELINNKEIKKMNTYDNYKDSLLNI